jgi:hypothetical protein
MAGTAQQAARPNGRDRATAGTAQQPAPRTSRHRATAGTAQQAAPRNRRHPARVQNQQQSRCCWIGGQGTVPYEQNTQQSPGSGRRRVLQAGHS